MRLSMMIIWDYPDAKIIAQHNVSKEKLSEYKSQIADIMDKPFIDPEVQRVINTIDSLR